MKQRLSIRLPGIELSLDTLLEWALFTTGGQPEFGTATVAELGRRWGGRQGPAVTVVAPAAEVQLTLTRIPSRQLRQIKQALPYMVEELIAEPIEQVHLAIPPVLPEIGEALPVAVISHQRLIHWLDVLYSQGLRVQRMVPEMLAVPWQPQTLSLLLDGERLLWRDSPWHGFELALDELPQLLQWLHSTPFPPPAPLLRIYAGQADARAGDIADRLRAELALELDQQSFAGSLWLLLATHLEADPERSINLLQGGYKVRGEHGAQQTGWRSTGWRTAAGIAAAGVLLYSLLLLGSGAWFNWRADQLEAQSAAVYRQIFPAAQRVVSPRRQLAAQLGRGGDNSLLPLLAGVGELGTAVQLEQLRYRGNNNELQLEVRTSALQELEQARRTLLQAGFQSELASAAETETGVRGRLLLRGAQR